MSSYIFISQLSHSFILLFFCTSHPFIYLSVCLFILPIFLSSELDSNFFPEMTNNVAKLIPAYSLGWISKPFRYLKTSKMYTINVYVH